MRRLFLGTDGIAINDAIKQLSCNISELQDKLGGVRLNDCASPQIRKFYEDKIETQKVTLEWLKRHRKKVALGGER